MTTLTEQDIKTIRHFLPYDFRKQLCEANPGLTERNISETLYCRTRNHTWAKIVFTAVSSILAEAGQNELAAKCLGRIQICKAANRNLATV